MIDLTKEQAFMVRQKVEMAEAITGFETENTYAVTTTEGETVAWANEQSGTLGRLFLRSHRPLRFAIADAGSKQIVARASRKFFWFFSHLHVSRGATPIGSIHRRWSFFARRFTLVQPTDTPAATIRGPLFRPNTFMVNRDGMEVARITKAWSGFIKEGFSRADNFAVQFSDASLDNDFRLLVVAAALAIDLDFFEDRNR